MCQEIYAEDSIQMIVEQIGTKLVHCSCAKCGHAIIAILLETAGWISSIGLITDLEAQDVLRFQQTQTISSDECVQFHEFLEGSSRELCRELKAPKSHSWRIMDFFLF